MGDRGHNRHGPRNGWGRCAVFFWVSWVPIEHKVAWAEAYLHTKWHLIHPAVWPQRTLAENWGGLCPFRGGGLCPHLTQCRVGRGLPPYQVASSSVQPFGHNRRRLKIGGSVPLWGGVGSPSNTRLTSIASDISMHQAVWPQ